MTIRKIARIVRAATADADIARGTAHSPQFRKAVTKDRRSALSAFTTVKHALKDRERIQARTPDSKTEAPQRRGRTPGSERAVAPSEGRNRNGAGKKTSARAKKT